MGVVVISIWISSYQVVDMVRKNGRIVVRSRIFPIDYQIWSKMKQKMNRMQKIIYERKYNIFHRFFLCLVIPIRGFSHEDTNKFVKNFVIVVTSINRLLIDYQL